MTRWLLGPRLQTERLFVDVFHRDQLLSVIEFDQAEVRAFFLVEETGVVQFQIDADDWILSAKTVPSKEVVGSVHAFLLHCPVEIADQVAEIERHLDDAAARRARDVVVDRASRLDLFEQELVFAFEDGVAFVRRQIDDFGVRRDADVRVAHLLALADTQRQREAIAFDDDQFAERASVHVQAHRLERDAQQRQRQTWVLGEPQLRVDVQTLVRQRILLQLLNREALASELGTRLVEVVRDFVVQFHVLAVTSFGSVAADHEIFTLNERVTKRVRPVRARRAVGAVRLNARAHDDVRQLRHQIGVLRDVERNLLVVADRARRRDFNDRLDKVRVTKVVVHKQRYDWTRDNRDVFQSATD